MSSINSKVARISVVEKDEKGSILENGTITDGIFANIVGTWGYVSHVTPFFRGLEFNPQTQLCLSMTVDLLVKVDRIISDY